ARALQRGDRPGQGVGRRRRHELTAPARRRTGSAVYPSAAMSVHSAQIRVSTAGDGDIIDITPGVREIVDTAGVRDGLVNVFVAHATAAVTLIEYEPGGAKDRPEVLN